MTEAGAKKNIKRFAFSSKLGSSLSKNNELPKSITDKLEFLKTHKESIKQNSLNEFICKKNNLLDNNEKEFNMNDNDCELLSIVSHRTAGLVNSSKQSSSPRLSNLLKRSSSETTNGSSNKFFKNLSQESYKPLPISVAKSKSPSIMTANNDDLDFDAVLGDDGPFTSSQRSGNIQKNAATVSPKSPEIITPSETCSKLSLIKKAHSQPVNLQTPSLYSDRLPKYASSSSASSISQPLSGDYQIPQKKFKFGKPQGKFAILVPFHKGGYNANSSSSTIVANSLKLHPISNSITSNSIPSAITLNSNTGSITSSNSQSSRNFPSNLSHTSSSPIKKSISSLELPKIKCDTIPKVLSMPRPPNANCEGLEEQERFMLSNIDWEDDDDVEWDNSIHDIDKTILDSPPRKKSTGKSRERGQAGSFITPDDYVDDDFDFSQLGVLDSPPRNRKTNVTPTKNKKSNKSPSKNDNSEVFTLDDSIDWANFNDDFDYKAKSNIDVSLNDSLVCGPDGESRFIPIDKDARTRKDDTGSFQKEYPHSLVLREILHEKFGLKQFRPNQQEIINATLEQHDCFVLMPTGGGKSLCYQLPAILTPGVTVVISPLRALIVDQVNKLNSLDIPAAHMCSDISKERHNEVMRLLTQLEPAIKLLYLTPEKIVSSKQTYDTLAGLYARGKLARIVLDEAHCLSQWGHDFRPDYKQLKTLKVNFPKMPIMCLTATATHVVQQDVTNILKLKQVKTFIRSFNRSNIKYAVLEKTKAIATVEIIKLILQNFKRMSGIVYCLVRKDCDTLAMDLRKNGIKAKSYHAGLADKVREQVQSQWMNNEYHVICATIAFGMGIDKPDVRFVIHNSMPKSIEAFYQESGRGGRDGETAYSYLFYAYSDVVRLQKLIQMDKSIQKKSLDAHFDQIQQMAQFCENRTDCRRYLQLQHLGEKFNRQLCIKDKKTICDNCANFGTINVHDVSKESQELATLVKDIGGYRNFTMLHFVDVYKGSKLKKILDWKHNCHKFYGAGAHLDKSDIQRILKELSFKKVLKDVCQYSGEFPIIYIKPGPNYDYIFKSDIIISIPLKGKAKRSSASTSKPYNVANETPVEPEIVIVNSPTKRVIPQKTKTPSSPSKTPEMRIFALKVKCHEELLEKCAEFAAENHSNLSTIMNLSALKVMSEEMPSTAEDFLKIQYVTKANFEKFGKVFLRITQKYRIELNKIEAETAISDLNMDVLTDDWDSGANTSTGSAGTSKRGKKRYHAYKRAWAKKKSIKRF